MDLFDLDDTYSVRVMVSDRGIMDSAILAFAGVAQFGHASAWRD